MGFIGRLDELTTPAILQILGLLKKTGWQRLGGILVEKGLSTPHVVSRGVQYQIEQVLLEFLRRESGFFRFESMEMESEDKLIQAGGDSQRLLHGALFKKTYGENTGAEILQECDNRLEGAFVARRDSEGAQ